MSLVVTPRSVARASASRTASWRSAVPIAARTRLPGQAATASEQRQDGPAEHDLDRDARNSDEQAERDHGEVLQENPHGYHHDAESRKRVQPGERHGEERAGGEPHHGQPEDDVA